MFNPKLQDFLDKHKDITLLGLGWACYWRLSLAISVGYVGILIFFFILYS